MRQTVSASVTGCEETAVWVSAPLGRSAIDSSSQVVVPAKCDGCRSNNMNDRRRLPKILDLINGDVLPCLWTFEGGLP